MFKTLFTTLMLCGTVSATPLKQTRVNNLGQVYSIYGAYCFRDTFDNEPVSVDVGEYVYLDYQTIDYHAKMTFFDVGGPWYGNTDIDNFDIYIDGANDLWTVHLYDGGYTWREPIDFGVTDIDDLVQSCRGMILFFPSPLSVNEDGYKLFNSIFTSSGNSYVNSYTGWYTITNTSNNYNFDINGFMNIDNNLYNRLEYVNRDCKAYYSSGYETVLSQDSYYITVVDNGTLISSPTIYFENVMIPYYLETSFATLGSYSYVYEPVNYSFGELVFSVIDAPIYMLSQLFSFELFGIQFYTAFVSIITLVLICFVVRKMI